ncbi:MAG TPA: maleylpyruvate isomerase family mycothiol-dependent enzyme, partial [Candidatus Dormibacteraeota bacterium]|nr:maleylpyruvate isomerase family mycothiol-dependent enzyme [Candidatus Dormibacteraeota bacterium]
DIGPDGATARPALASTEASCTVRGTASDLFLFLWNRTGSEGLGVDGDAALLDLWRAGVRVRWT